MIIRLGYAHESDIPAVLELGRAMAAEAPRWRDVPWDDARIEAVVRRLLGGQGGALILARDEDDVLLGMVAGVLATDWFTGLPYAAPLALYVRPQHRSRRLGRDLIEAFEGWARVGGAAEVYLGTHTGIDEAGFVALATRAGYSHAGATLRKVL